MTLPQMNRTSLSINLVLHKNLSYTSLIQRHSLISNWYQAAMYDAIWKEVIVINITMICCHTSVAEFTSGQGTENMNIRNILFLCLIFSQISACGCRSFSEKGEKFCVSFLYTNIWVFPKCFSLNSATKLFVITVKGFELATSCARNQMLPQCQ